MATNIDGQRAHEWKAGSLPASVKSLAKSLSYVKGNDSSRNLVIAISSIVDGYSYDLIGAADDTKYRSIVDLIIKRISAVLGKEIEDYSSGDLESFKKNLEDELAKVAGLDSSSLVASIMKLFSLASASKSAKLKHDLIEVFKSNLKKSNDSIEDAEEKASGEEEELNSDEDKENAAEKENEDEDDKNISEFKKLLDSQVSNVLESLNSASMSFMLILSSVEEKIKQIDKLSRGLSKLMSGKFRISMKFRLPSILSILIMFQLKMINKKLDLLSGDAKERKFMKKMNKILLFIKNTTKMMLDAIQTTINNTKKFVLESVIEPIKAFLNSVYVAVLNGLVHLLVSGGIGLLIIFIGIILSILLRLFVLPYVDKYVTPYVNKAKSIVEKFSGIITGILKKFIKPVVNLVLGKAAE